MAKFTTEDTVTDAGTKKSERKRQVAAFDAITANRPLKPPAYRPTTIAVTAGQLALKQDMKDGSYTTAKAFYPEDKR